MQNDVYSSVKSMVGAIVARGGRINPAPDVKFPYAVGFLEGALNSMINKLPQKQQDMLVSEMRKIALECLEVK